jgi:membrane protein
VVVITIAGLTFERGPVQQELLTTVEKRMGPSARDRLDSAIGNIRQSVQESGGTVPILVGVVGVLLGASAVFRNLLIALNKVWDVPTRKHTRLWGFIRRRLLGFALMLGAGAILLLSAVIGAGLQVVESWMTDLGALRFVRWLTVDLLGSLIVTTLLVGLVFQIVPDADLNWRHVTIGSVVTAMLITLGRYLAGLYLAHSSFRTIYGAAGSIFVMLVSFYIAWLLFFWGAEFTHVLSRMRGQRVRTDGQ